MKTPPAFSFLCCGMLCCSGIALAQVPDAAPPAGGGAPAAAAPASGAAPAGAAAGGHKGSFLGKDVPAFDPGSDIMTWDGKSWNVSNNRIFQARFEKYLNAPEETTQADRQYQLVISTILNDLAPANVSGQNLDAAFRLLPRGSSFDIDARLCDALADAVLSAWRSQRAHDRLDAATASLMQERRQEQRQPQPAPVFAKKRYWAQHYTHLFGVWYKILLLKAPALL